MLPHEDKEEKQARYGEMNRGRYKEKERKSQERKSKRFGGVRDQ